MNRLIAWLLYIPPEPRSAWNVIAWWEKRRPLYNLFLILFCGANAFAFLYAEERLARSQPGTETTDGFVFFVAPLLANLFYTAGWIVELGLRRIKPAQAAAFAPKALCIGSFFSLVVSALPLLITVAQQTFRP